ncbi:MAG: AI-2E family transporter [bacterium]
MKKIDLFSSKIILIPIFLGSIVLTVFLLQIVFGFLSQFGWLFISFIYAYIIYVFVAPLDKLLQKIKIPSKVSLILSFLIILLILSLSIIFINPVLTQELNNLADQIKRNNFNSSFDLFVNDVARLLNTDPLQLRDSVIGNITKFAESITSNMINILSNAFFTSFQIVLALIIGYFFIKEGNTWFERFLKLIPQGYRNEVHAISEYFNRSASSFLRVQVFMAFIYGVINFMVMSGLGISFALTSSIVAFVTFIVPGVGPFISVLIPIIVAFLFDANKVVLLIIILLFVQQIILNVLIPRLYGDKVGVHPLVILLSILIGIQLFGVLGVLIFIPVVTVIINVASIYFEKTIRLSNSEEVENIKEL